MNNIQILLKHNYVSVASSSLIKSDTLLAEVATLSYNLAYYGYAVSVELLNQLKTLTRKELNAFWEVLNRY